MNSGKESCECGTATALNRQCSVELLHRAAAACAQQQAKVIWEIDMVQCETVTALVLLQCWTNGAAKLK